MPSTSPVDVVQAWQEAVNHRHIEQVIQLSKPDIEIVGPRGSGFGYDLLRQWFDHARVELEPLRAYARGAVVVVAQHGIWRSPETGNAVGEANVASVFRVEEGQVAYYARLDSLEEALEQTGLAENDEVNLIGA